jgi:ketosteroid isomerase-like protein
MSTACQRQAAADLTQADKDAVRAEIEKYSQAGLAADWNAWGNTLTADVVISPANVAPMTGREAAVAWVKSLPKLADFTVKIDEITGRDDVAYARGTYALALTLPNGSSAIDRGAFLEIHRRQPDGSWPYTHLMFHSTEPLPAAPSSGKK